MSLDLEKHKDSFVFIPLGGSGEIGMNLNLYYLNGKFLMIDCGAGFADEDLPGVDLILPDISFILKNKKDLLGLVLTHAHEDHLGAIIYLWEEINCPIYATPFTAAFLKAKLEESTGFKANITVIEPGSNFSLGCFDLELVQLTHSTPEMNAVMINTKYGSIFHSGDWKFDPNPLLGPVSDMDKLKSYGEKGVLAMVSDSTNVFSAGKSGSEGDLRKSLSEIVPNCEGMVFVTTFASNVARLETIAKVAEDSKRSIIVAGRSLWRIINVAKSVGYLKDAAEFHKDDEIKNFDRDKVLVLATGCQGESLAAMNKIIFEKHRNITIKKNDTVIFSSKIIPGNDKRIFKMFNRCIRMGIEVITEREHFVHVSGHPNIDDMKLMYDIIKPEISIPVHGEDTHMREHANLATSWGVKHAIKVENGHAIKIAPGVPEKIGFVPAGVMALDGKSVLSPKSSIFSERSVLKREGLILVILTFNADGLMTEPKVLAPGVLCEVEDKEIFSILEEETESTIINIIESNKKKSSLFAGVNKAVQKLVKRIVFYQTGKRPLIKIHISNIY